MRRLFIYITTLLVLSCTKDLHMDIKVQDSVQSSFDDSKISNQLKESYRHHAHILAVQWMLADSLLKDEPIIHSEWVDIIYKGLVCFHNAKAVRGQQKIMSVNGVATNPDFSLTAFSFAVDSVETWAWHINTGDKQTGHTGLDALMLEYNLSIKSVNDNMQGEREVTLSSIEQLNTSALFSRVEQICHIRPTIWSSFMLDGPDMFIGYDSGLYSLHFYTRWGDCPSGCIHEHYWFYLITPQAQVRCEFDDGDPMP